MESRRESRREREVGGKVGIVEANQIGHRTFPTSSNLGAPHTLERVLSGHASINTPQPYRL